MTPTAVSECWPKKVLLAEKVPQIKALLIGQEKRATTAVSPFYFFWHVVLGMASCLAV